MSEPNEELARLAQDPAWKILFEQIEAAMDRHWNTVAREFSQKNKQPDYAELQWYRGYFACMKAWHRGPVLAANDLAKQLAKDRGEPV